MEDKFGLYAKALPECCDEILQGNFDIFTDLVRDIKQHHKDREEWETNLYLNSDLASADRAFKAKEYAKCIELLSPIQDHLSPAFKKKLTYAQKHT